MPRPATSPRRSGRLAGVIALLVAVPAALALPAAVAVPAGTAYAAAAPAPAQGNPAAVRTARPVHDPRSTARPPHTTAGLATDRTHAPRGATRPAAPPAAHRTARPATAVLRAHRAAAATAALHAAAPHRAAAPRGATACGGALTPDTVTPCTAAAAGTDSYTVTLTGTADVLFVEATQTGGAALPLTVTAPDGTTAACAQAQDWAGPQQCRTTRAGTYTVAVTDEGAAYTLAYSALLTDTGCAALDTSYAAPDTHVTLAAGSAGACYTLAAAPGDVLDTAYTSSQANVAVFDATGTQVCFDRGDCALTGTAPYRVMATDYYGAADAFTLRLNRISAPQGCAAAPQLTYGTAPDTTSADRCRTLTVTTAGPYRIYAADAADPWVTGTLYGQDGTPACTGGAPYCPLTAGTYDFVLNEDPSASDTFGVVFLAAAESRGCTATGDTGFAAGPATGTSAGYGASVCLTLPTAAGKTLYLFNEPPAGDPLPNTGVVDATGAQVCPVEQFVYHTCTLTGTAPFRVVLSALGQGDPYRLLAQRTDSTRGCTAWPRSGFGGTYGATASITADTVARCLTIPANAHSTGEMIDYANPANTIDAAVYVNDPAGQEICVANSLAVCAYTPGTSYTALLIGTGGPDTYHLVRRDVSRTATCARPASTTVGGPSTGEPLTSDLDAACVRVTAAATDDLWMSARATAPAPAGVVTMVADPTGQIICYQYGVSCQITGSTDYQVIVVASGYAGVTIPAHLDTWRVATASGWAPQCTAHPLSGNGFTHRATLTETSTAYCAVVSLGANGAFGVYGKSSGVSTAQPWVSMYSQNSWTGQDLCYGLDYGTFAFSCDSGSGTPAQDVLIVSPGTAPTPVSFSAQGLCTQGCATPPAVPAPASVTPATAPSGTSPVITLHGTGLDLGDTVQVGDPSTGSSAGAVVTAATAGGTALTVQLYLAGAAPGTYDLDVTSPSGAWAQLPAAFTVTAA